MSFTVIIPARFASTRLPGKPLQPIAGMPMIQHVYQRSCASGAERVVIATDDQRVAEACRVFTNDVLMTSPNHESGTDRLQEAAQQLGLSDEQIVVNVQGDEPLIPAQVIDQVAGNLAAAKDCAIATLSEVITEPADIFNPNVVKVVVSEQGRALYFSRAPIPWQRDWAEQHFSVSSSSMPKGINYYRHLGIYAYRVSFLNQFVRWPVSPLEQSEKLEQLRALYHSQAIHVATSCVSLPPGVDTEQDLARVRQWFDDRQET